MTLEDLPVSLSKTIYSSGEEAIVGFCISVSPRFSRTGLLEERGEWIRKFWSECVKNEPQIFFCRPTWDELFGYLPAFHQDYLIKIIKKVLSASNFDNLSSKLIVDYISGNYEEKMDKIDYLTHAIGSSEKLKTFDYVLAFLNETEV